MKDQQLTEQQIRKIVQEELVKNYKSGNPQIPPHNHDGNNNLKISQRNIIPLTKGNGTIDMATSGVYKLKLGNYGLVPSSITFYGGALSTAGSGMHAMVVGNAQLGNNQQFQPETTKSVILGPVQTTIIQGCGSILIDDSNVNNTVIRNSEDHIVYVQNISGTVLATADVTSFNNSEIIITTDLTANWSISGLWIIT